MTHHYLVYIAAGLLTCSLLGKTPNLIIILTDDQGYNDVGFNGCSDIPTPHLDQLAADGVRFTDGYVSFPVCGPSRAGLLTGRYQDRFGFTTNPTIDPNNPDAGLPKSEENIAEVLNKANYSSAIIGKWHMGSHTSNHPLNRQNCHRVGGSSSKPLLPRQRTYRRDGYGADLRVTWRRGCVVALA